MPSQILQETGTKVITERFRLLRIKHVGNSLGSSLGQGIGVGGFSFSTSFFLLLRLLRLRRRLFFFPRFLGGWKSENMLISNNFD